MLNQEWRDAHRDWQKTRVTYPSSLEATVLFSLLGLVVTALYLTNDLLTPAPVNMAALLHVLQ